MGRPRKLTPAQEKKLVRAVKKGELSYPEIAEEFGVGEWKARQLAREHGVKKPPTPRVQVIRKNGKTTTIRTSGAAPNMKTRKQIDQMRTKGKTLQEIGDKLGISRQRVYQILQKMLRDEEKNSPLVIADTRARRIARGKDPDTGKPLKKSTKTLVKRNRTSKSR